MHQHKFFTGDDNYSQTDNHLAFGCTYGYTCLSWTGSYWWMNWWMNWFVMRMRVCVPGTPGCARTDWSDGIGNEPHAWKFARTLMSRTVSSPFGRCRTCATHTHNPATVTETPQADPPWRGRLPPPHPHPHPLATFRSPEDRVRTRVRPRSSRCASIVGTTTTPPSSNSFPSPPPSHPPLDTLRSIGTSSSSRASHHHGPHPCPNATAPAAVETSSMNDSLQITAARRFPTAKRPSRSPYTRT